MKTAIDSPGENVVAQYGKLQVVNGQLCDQSGNPVQLKGVSSHGLQWYPFDRNTIRNLVEDWQISLIRAAVYTQEGGYLDHPALMKQRVEEIIQQGIDEGIYVILDWHILSDNNPNSYQEEAQAFFEEMAATYGSYPNILYEICNEPNGMDITWNDQIKPYAETIIPAIRRFDPDNIIIVGTDTWSQGVKEAAANPLNFNNILYALHFYAGSHSEWLREDAEDALAKGIGIFVTEWGVSNYTGNGGNDLFEAQRWIDWMAMHQISWANWAFGCKDESCAALKPGVSLNGPWSSSQLTTSGLWVRSTLVHGKACCRRK